MRPDRSPSQISASTPSPATTPPEPVSPLNKPSINVSSRITLQSNFRRYQTLHVIHFSKCPRRASWPSKLEQYLSNPIFTAVTLIFKVSLTVILALFGMYGTGMILLCSSITQLVTHSIKIHRPPGFLGNNESHDACMLIATHQNSSIWYLFVGDRGIVDSLLNKTMIVIPQQQAAAAWLRMAHFIQLLAMTFVASQKGWDGVTLLTLLCMSTLMQLRFCNEMLTRMFCEENGVVLKQESFEFSGRTPMVGAIHRVSRCSTWKWMDEILAACPRRDVWAKQLSVSDAQIDAPAEELDSLSEGDKTWVWMNNILALRGADLMQRAM